MISKKKTIGIVTLCVIVITITNIASAQGISPFTEIGNLEMETLAAINDIIVELTKQTERIDSLNATEISEQAEQDGMQIDIANLQVNLTTIEARLTIEEAIPKEHLIQFNSFQVNGLAGLNDVFIGTNTACVVGGSNTPSCEDASSYLIPTNGTIKHLYVMIPNTVINDYNFTVYKNDIATNLSCVILAYSSPQCSDLTNFFTIQQDDTIAMGNSRTIIGGGEAGQSVKIGIILMP